MPTLKTSFFAYFFLLSFTFLPLFGNNYSQSIACDCYPGYSRYQTPEPYFYPEQPYYVPPQEQLVKQKAPEVAIPSKEEAIRAAIDIGSGATKLRVAQVNLKDRKIEKILVNESFPVQYQEQLSKNPQNMFDENVMRTGIDAIKKSKEIANKYHAQKVIAVATASFRKAANSQEFIDRIYKETGVQVYVIDQELEGKLAFNAVLSQGNYDPKDLIVWDIGGGSLQMTALDEKGNYQIFRGEVASIHFKNMMIEHVQKRSPDEITTPNPMATDEIHEGLVHARELATKVDKVFKDRIKAPGSQIVGVGNIFAYGIYPLVGNKSPYTKEELNQALMTLAHKSDEELGGGEYINVLVSNSILVLGYMQGLNIHQMEALDVNNADGAVLYQDFWN